MDSLYFWDLIDNKIIMDYCGVNDIYLILIIKIIILM
jgi:hypothetical protein